MTKTQIQLYNTRTRRKEPFAPIDKDNVRMYVCGPTVYDRAHLGNARPVVVFDVLYRLLRHEYGADHVTYVRNFTDVDDKINARARALQAAGDPRDMNAIIRTLTDETIGWYHADMDALGALRPTHEPRATEYIGDKKEDGSWSGMIGMIETLTKRESKVTAEPFAYEEQGHVLFDVRSYSEYGKLSGRSIDDMIAGARVEVAPYKRNPMDFVLWKPSTPEEPGWDSPWGRGRPGWHIECSAMAHELLGESFDIHGGGIDLAFPHHENEIAQSCCAYPEGGFAKVWMHNEMVQVDGKKMSKSLGNFFTVLDLLFGDGVPGEVIRFVMLLTHYRKPMDWTGQKAKEAEKTLRKWHYICLTSRPSKRIPPKFIAALSDDLNTSQAITILHEYAKDGNGSDLLVCANLLGLLEPSTSLWFDPDDYRKLDDDPRIYEVTRVRIHARAQGRYDLSDMLRRLLIEAGVAVCDHKLTSGAFREPDALVNHALTISSKAWDAGKHEEAKKYIDLLNAAGFIVHIDEDGPSAITGFDEVEHERHFQASMNQAVVAADAAMTAMENPE